MKMLVISLLFVVGCGTAPMHGAKDYAPEPYVKVAHPEWTKDAVIYQVNTRQFTKKGTLDAAQTHLHRIAEMGVDVVWLMPIHPIGEKMRKGSLGSPYAVRDYRTVNPDFGDEDDLRNFVGEAHRLGMFVILDWVANHSAWDNPLSKTHLDWYTKTPEGELTAPLGTDWIDTVDFDYSQAGLRNYMTDSLVYWVREFDIDGYRADVAGFVPLDFWENVRAELDEVKPVFLLAEWESRDLHARAFDATYAWTWKDAMKKTANEGGANAIRGYYATQRNTWPDNAYRMVYTDNHDQNAWDGVASEIYGGAYETAIALSFVGSGMPLIHNGQEADLDHQLEFFEKDEIIWREGKHSELFRKLIDLKHSTKALWNGASGAPMIEVPNNKEDQIFAFLRGDEEERVFAIFNLSDKPQDFQLSMRRHIGSYLDVFSGESATFEGGDEMTLGPWAFQIYKTRN